MRRETKLSLACALMTTGYTRQEFENPTQLKYLVIAAVEDWYMYASTSSSQWFAEDKEAVMADLKRTSRSKLQSVLREMGFGLDGEVTVYADGNHFSVNDRRFSQFVEDQLDAIEKGIADEEDGDVEEAISDWELTSDDFAFIDVGGFPLRTWRCRDGRTTKGTETS
ncbi:MAG: hypothetical protein ACYC0X_12225 [Pirellulaceae bacterium]